MEGWGRATVRGQANSHMTVVSTVQSTFWQQAGRWNLHSAKTEVLARLGVVVPGACNPTTTTTADPPPPSSLPPQQP